MDPQRPTRFPADRQAASRSGTTKAGGSNGRRRRRTKRTYLVRRLVVLAVFVGVVYGVVSVARSAFGSDDAKTTAPSDVPTTPTAVDGSTTVPIDPTASSGADPATSTSALADTTTIATAPDAGTTPTAADPARVLLVGDSEAGGLSPFLSKVLAPTGVVALTTDYKSSTGLVRPDFFDWPGHLQATVPGENPDIVVALFGGNDGQSFLPTDTAAGAAAGKPVDSDAWRAEYGKRVGALMDFLGSGGRTLIWVGVPNAEKDDLTAALTVQNDVVKGEVAKRPNVVFVDSWHTFAGINGGFAPYIVDPRDGEAKPVRSQTDGFHLNSTGEDILAFLVGNAVVAELHKRGAAF